MAAAVFTIIFMLVMVFFIIRAMVKGVPPLDDPHGPEAYRRRRAAGGEGDTGGD